MRRLLFALAALLATGFTANAQFTSLRGPYAVQGTITCLNTAFNFNSALQPQGSSYLTISTWEGVRHFHPDGTGFVTLTIQSVVVPGPGVATPSVSVSTRTNGFKYVMGADGESFEIPGGTVVNTITSGPRTGQTSTVTNPNALQGLTGDNAQQITITSLDPGVETIVFSGPPSPTTEYRICQSSETDIKLPHGP